MVNIAVLGSTRGTDLQAIIDCCEEKKLHGVTIKFVLSNKKDAGILDRARGHNLKAMFLSPLGKTREEYDAEVTELLVEHDVELLLLIGYMKLMGPKFVQRWLNRVMNIHPSLLPAFAGAMDLNVHQAVLERGCKVTGASLIFIDEYADTGPIISQRAVAVTDEDTADSLKVKVQKEEGEMLVEALAWWRDGRIKVNGTSVSILE